MKDPIIFHENKDVLFLSQEWQDRLREDPRSILWTHNGLYGMLPEAIIQNELRVRADRYKLWMSEANSDTREKYRGAAMVYDWELPLAFNWRETEAVLNGALIVSLIAAYSDYDRNPGFDLKEKNDVHH